LVATAIIVASVALITMTQSRRRKKAQVVPAPVHAAGDD
jgi:hypothetical protein